MDTNFEQLKMIVRDAWRTLSILPDPDARFRRVFGGGWPLPVVNDPNTAYGATPASWIGTATAHEISVMEAVFSWLSWLRQQTPVSVQDYEIMGEYAIKRIAAWGMGQPIWKLAQRERCSERTIRRRIDRSIRKIGMKFKKEISMIIPRFKLLGPDPPPINEPEIRPGRIRGFRQIADGPYVESPATLEPGKVYIGGEGMRFKGQKYHSPLDHDEKSCGKRRR